MTEGSNQNVDKALESDVDHLDAPKEHLISHTASGSQRKRKGPSKTGIKKEIGEGKRPSKKRRPKASHGPQEQDELDERIDDNEPVLARKREDEGEITLERFTRDEKKSTDIEVCLHKYLVGEMVVPLCRVKPTTWVRGITKPDINKFKESIKSGLLDGCVFRVTLIDEFGNVEPCPSFDGHWKTINDEFDNSLSDDQNKWGNPVPAMNSALEDVQGNMLFCWDGNHRTTAWMEYIQENLRELEDYKRFMVKCRIYRGDKMARGAIRTYMFCLNKVVADSVVQRAISDEVDIIRNVLSGDIDEYLSLLTDAHKELNKKKLPLTKHTWVKIHPIIAVEIQHKTDIEVTELSAARKVFDTNPSPSWDDIHNAKQEARELLVTQKRNLMNKWLPVCHPLYADVIREVAQSEIYQFGKTKLTKELLVKTVTARIDHDFKFFLLSMWQWTDLGKRIVGFPTYKQCTVKVYEEFVSKFTAVAQIILDVFLIVIIFKSNL